LARGRFISKSITTDREINALSSDTSRLAFTWLLTFADCEGRVTGEPDLLLASLFPRRQDITPDLLETFIQEWASAGFIVWYLAPDGDRYIQFLNFSKHQIGLRKDREAFNPIPAPENAALLAGTLPDELRQSSGTTPDQLRSNSGLTPAEVKVKDKDKDEVNDEVNREVEPTAAAALPEQLQFESERAQHALDHAKHKNASRPSRNALRMSEERNREVEATAAAALPEQLQFESKRAQHALDHAQHTGAEPTSRNALRMSEERNWEVEATAASEPLLTLYSEEIGPLTPAIRAQLLQALHQYGEDRLTYAILEASHHNVRSWKYIHAILTANPNSPPARPTYPAQNPPTNRPLTALEVVKAEMRRVGCDPAGIFKP